MNFMKTYKVMFREEKCINSLPMKHSVIILPHHYTQNPTGLITQFPLQADRKWGGGAQVGEARA